MYLITFDDYGVSGHTNHISIYHAVSDAIDQGIFKQKLYTLQSVPIMIKYSFLFGAFWTKLNAKEDSTRIWFISTVTE
ncbi:hypothetical protein HDV02_003449 [Globomyces sp. JEL0801]|nr:hypothetical protein HDV02_003435 [Globomyces sp. JEL0801]KAJ2999160.1 hypothetical protein HDV02_003449 [Globomyces sp. JEL0801]